jgi:sulfur-oxidizing protein SoxA
MKKIICPLIIFLGSLSVWSLTYADPESDIETIKHYFKSRFPHVPVEEYVNGVYALDENSRLQWEDIEEFPPYEIDIDNGEELFQKTFSNGKSYADCFSNGGMGIKQNYPYFDTEGGRVVTLELAINECREANDEEPLKYGKGEIASLSAYMAYTSRDKQINIVIPDDPRAMAAYEKGKKFFYSRRGQLNMACATCHIGNAGNRLRADILSPALGQTTHFPVFRSKWEEVGTLQRRYAGCNKQIRAKPFELQSEEYRNLEYFHTYMSNGLLINGPGARK